jgi:hypothetical protein
MDSALGLFFLIAFCRALFEPIANEVGYRLERRALQRRGIVPTPTDDLQGRQIGS